MQDLLEQVAEWNAAHAGDEGMQVRRVRMCKINSGLFGVPWEETVEVLEGIDLGGGEGGGGDEGEDEGVGVREIEVWERE